MQALTQASTYWPLMLHSNPLCLGLAFVVRLEIASATARSTRYAKHSPSDRGLGLDPIDCAYILHCPSTRVLSL